MGSKQIPVFKNHDVSQPPVGKASFLDADVEALLASGEYVLAPGYKILETNEKGEVTKAELLELSLIPSPK